MYRWVLAIPRYLFGLIYWDTVFLNFNNDWACERSEAIVFEHLDEADDYLTSYPYEPSVEKLPFYLKIGTPQIHAMPD